MTSSEKIQAAGDKNPCEKLYSALYMDEYYDALRKLRDFCEDSFQEMYQNALEQSCYKHLVGKYCRVEFLKVNPVSHSTCSLIEIHFLGYPVEEAEWEDAGLVNIHSQAPVEDKFRLYEYELVDYIK